MGKLSRDKGARFERRCIKAIAAYTGWPHWERTARSVTQPNGDLRPVNADGTACHMAEKYFVECKVRATLSPGELSKWLDDVWAAYGSPVRCIYLIAQDRGPILVFDSSKAVSHTKYVSRSCPGILHDVSIIL